jgi:hypothetical protein
LAREVEVLRRCTDWLQRLESGENVVVKSSTRCRCRDGVCCFRPAAGGPRTGTNRSRLGYHQLRAGRPARGQRIEPL